MGGKEAVQKLLEIDPRAKAVVSSGYSNDPVMADFKKHGFRGVAAKPYSIHELTSTVQKVLLKDSDISD
jgi:DNA-binding NarL/FixJ family response regulator